MRIFKNAYFTFPSFWNRPEEIHEVANDQGHWIVRYSDKPMREANRVVTEDGEVLKDRDFGPSRPYLKEVLSLLQKCIRNL
jgi:hypothetical protein